MPKFPWWTCASVFAVIQVQSDIIAVVYGNLLDRLDSRGDRGTGHKHQDSMIRING
jgi:hypothetical protein